MWRKVNAARHAGAHTAQDQEPTRQPDKAAPSLRLAPKRSEPQPMHGRGSSRW